MLILITHTITNPLLWEWRQNKHKNSPSRPSYLKNKISSDKILSHLKKKTRKNKSKSKTDSLFADRINFNSNSSIFIAFNISALLLFYLVSNMILWSMKYVIKEFKHDNNTIVKDATICIEASMIMYLRCRSGADNIL